MTVKCSWAGWSREVISVADQIYDHISKNTIVCLFTLVQFALPESDRCSGFSAIWKGNFEQIFIQSSTFQILSQQKQEVSFGLGLFPLSQGLFPCLSCETPVRDLCTDGKRDQTMGNQDITTRGMTSLVSSDGETERPSAHHRLGASEAQPWTHFPSFSSCHRLIYGLRVPCNVFKYLFPSILKTSSIFRSPLCYFLFHV